MKRLCDKDPENENRPVVLFIDCGQDYILRVYVETKNNRQETEPGTLYDQERKWKSLKVKK